MWRITINSITVVDFPKSSYPTKGEAELQARITYGKDAKLEIEDMSPSRLSSRRASSNLINDPLEEDFRPRRVSWGKDERDMKGGVR